MPRVEGRKPSKPEPLIPVARLLIDGYIYDPYYNGKRIRCVCCGQVFSPDEGDHESSWVVRAVEINKPVGAACGACTEKIRDYKGFH